MTIGSGTTVTEIVLFETAAQPIPVCVTETLYPVVPIVFPGGQITFPLAMLGFHWKTELPTPPVTIAVKQEGVPPKQIVSSCPKIKTCGSVSTLILAGVDTITPQPFGE